MLPPIEPARVAAIPDPTLNLVDTLLTLLAFFVAFIFCGLAVVLVVFMVRGPHAIDPKDPASAVLLGLPIQLAAYLLTVAFMAFYVQSKYGVGLLRAVRWNTPTRNLAWLALGGGAVLALGSQLGGRLLERWIPKSMPIEQFFSTPKSAYMLAAFGILVAPLVEELFFRGFLYPALARRLGQAAGIGLTAFLFTILHASQLAFSWAALLLIFLVGTVLTLVRARTNSVATGVLVHMGYNFTLFTMLFFATGHFHHLENM